MQYTYLDKTSIQSEETQPIPKHYMHNLTKEFLCPKTLHEHTQMSQPVKISFLFTNLCSLLQYHTISILSQSVSPLYIPSAWDLFLGLRFQAFHVGSSIQALRVGSTIQAFCVRGGVLHNLNVDHRLLIDPWPLDYHLPHT